MLLAQAADVWAPALVNGLATAPFYALLAIPIVLGYQVTRSISFVVGGIAMFCGLLYWFLSSDYHLVGMRQTWLATQEWPQLPSLLVCVALGAVLGTAYGSVVMTRLTHWPRVAVTTFSLGAMMILIGLGTTLWGPLVTIPSIFGTRKWEILGEYVSIHQVAAGVIVALLVGSLTLILNRTRHGACVRALADDAEAAVMIGIPVRSLGITSWTVCGAIAGLTGPMIGMLYAVSPEVVPLMFLRALLLGLLGGFGSLGLLVAAAVLLAVVESVSGAGVAGSSLVGSNAGSARELILMGILLTAVLCVSKARGTVEELLESDTGPVVGGAGRERALTSLPRRPRTGGVVWGRLPPGYAAGGGVLVLGALAVLWPFYASGSYLFLTMAACVLVIAVLGLTVVVGWAGEISLFQAGLVGLATYTSAYAVRRDTMNWPFLAAVAVGVLLAVAVSVLVALPTSKLSGVYVMLLTLGAQVTIERAVFGREELGGGREFISIRRPVLFGIDFASDRAFYYLCLATVGIVVGLLALFRGSRHGRALLLVGTNRQAAMAVGISPRRYKIFAFAVAGALAGLAGALSPHLYGTVPFFGQYISFQSLFYLAMPVLAGFESLTAVCLVGLAFTLIPHSLESHNISPFILAGSALVGGLLLGRRGLGGVALDRLRASGRRQALALQAANGGRP